MGTLAWHVEIWPTPSNVWGVPFSRKEPIMKNLTSSVWWKATFFRMLRTAGVILTPYVPTILYTQNYAIAASAVGFAALGSFLTSLAGVAESEGKTVAWGWAILERSVKTAAQALLTLFGTATLFESVDWSAAPQLVGTAVLGSLLIAFMGFLPETDERRPLATASATTYVVNEQGNTGEQAVPVVATVDAPPTSAPEGTVG